ncbi:MAG TPA: hypothetical protein VN861_08730 [Candidatus Acidoferrales bacterium]|nr:hypothetical protein [Candidatus Acidoferrales bacterium]
MQFRLTYQGPLYADRGEEDIRPPRVRHKHDIRRQFHEQLVELWKVDSKLKQFTEQKIRLQDQPPGNPPNSLGFIDEVSNKNEVGKIKWMPLAHEDWGVGCGLDILFLRHEPKGGVIQSGDLDNRIKTLFDALRKPTAKEIPADVIPEQEPSPFFCLLSDDRLITEFRVTADRLLVPAHVPDAEVYLVIEVRTFIIDHQKALWMMGAIFHE